MTTPTKTGGGRGNFTTTQYLGPGETYEEGVLAGAISAGVFGQKWLGGLGGVSFLSQVVGTLTGVVIAVLRASIIYVGLKTTTGLRLDREQEFDGADLSIHKGSASPERETNW
jgi:Amt family ammonium transporter